LLLACTFILGAMSCARKPAPKSAANKIKHFFVKYGKKYPDTIYGKTPVTDVDVLSQEEIHKNLVSTEAFITLGTSNLKKIAVTFERRAYWKIISWEELL
jgi:hypothetical protein